MFRAQADYSSWQNTRSDAIMKTHEMQGVKNPPSYERTQIASTSKNPGGIHGDPTRKKTCFSDPCTPMTRAGGELHVTRNSRFEISHAKFQGQGM